MLQTLATTPPWEWPDGAGRDLLNVLRDPGSKATMGKPGWIFYRPDVRCLIDRSSEPEDDPNSTFLPPPSHTTPTDNVIRAILDFRRQLRQRNIELLVVPVPVAVVERPAKDRDQVEVCEIIAR